MRLSVTHTTRYRYDQPVFQEPHTFRLRPRHDASQSLLWHRLEITPAPAGRSECLDQDGNVVVHAWFRSPLAEMTVASEFEVETRRENPFDFMLARPELGTLPMVYQPPLSSALTPYLGAGEASAEVGELARTVAEKAGGATLRFLTELNCRLSEDMRHLTREEGPPFAPEVTLREGAGSCRDLAVLFSAVCRAVGIPARFVSGYEREAAFQERANMHAWAEVYLEGGGWRGYDPSAGLAASTSHIAVAAAADPRLAAPLSGTFRGGAKAEMEFHISMRAE